MTSVAVRDAAARRAAARPSADRLLGVLPLTGAFLAFTSLYLWLSWSHGTPWLFSDELEAAQLSRSIAETGHAARRGEPHFFGSLYTYLIAPAWWIDNTKTAYEVAKGISVVVMTATLFPAYALARLAVSRPWALFAAVASVSIPALAYSSLLVQEPLAYAYSTLTLFLIAKSLVVRRPGWLAGAAVACLVAPLVRSQLAVLPAVFAVGVALALWRGERARDWRNTWSRWDWAGGAVLLLGAVIVLNALISHRSFSWEIATRLYKDRMLEYGLWASGALTVGLGVFPVVAGLASLVRPRGEPPRRAVQTFTDVALASVLGFGFYAALKAAYLSAYFAERVVERNLIYLAPLLFVGTALVFERRRVHLAALGAASAFVAYLLVTTPLQMDVRLYSDAFGLAIVQAANRNRGWTPEHAETILLWMLLVSVIVLLLPLVVRGVTPVLVAVFAAAAVGVVAWNVTGAIAAGNASNDTAAQRLATFGEPYDWVDRATRGAPALYLGQQIDDATGIWLLEFWNRSLKHVWSLDGTAPQPGPTLTPDLGAKDGSLVPDPGVRYVVAEEGINLNGAVLERRGGWTLYRISPPLRLADATTGVYVDRWMGSQAGYSRYATPGMRAGFAVVSLDRKAWCGPSTPGKARVSIGPLVVGRDHQPAIGRVTRVAVRTIESCAAKRVVLPTPKPPFRVEVAIAPTFVPAELDPKLTDRRELGAGVSFGFSTRRP